PLPRARRCAPARASSTLLIFAPMHVNPAGHCQKQHPHWIQLSLAYPIRLGQSLPIPLQWWSVSKLEFHVGLLLGRLARVLFYSCTPGLVTNYLISFP